MRYRKRHIVEDIIAQKFPCIFEIDNKKCFKVNENTFFVVSFLNWDREIIVAEYADSEFEAHKGLFGEDGVLFYPDEMSEDENSPNSVSNFFDCTHHYRRSR